MIKLIQVIVFFILVNNTFAFATDNLQAYKTAVLLGHPVTIINMENMYFYGFDVKKLYQSIFIVAPCRRFKY